jgi:uncharacterized protein YndB with AHSA1/START domain
MTEASRGIEPAAPAAGGLVILRSFAAPRRLVWRAWTEPESLAQWWGPKGSTVRIIKLEVRPAGMFHYAMRHPNGRELFGRFVYREIDPPERLVYVSSFSDAAGGITGSPFSQLPVWPREILNELTLTERAGATTLSLRGRPVNATAEEEAAFARMLKSMQQGFAGSFDQLKAHLARSA